MKSPNAFDVSPLSKKMLVNRTHKCFTEGQEDEHSAEESIQPLKKEDSVNRQITIREVRKDVGVSMG